MTQYTELQLDALRELANIGSGNASTALSGMLGRSFAGAVDAAGPAEQEITGIVGEMTGTVLLLVPPADADGRTIRVDVASGAVTVREAGGLYAELEVVS